MKVLEFNTSAGQRVPVEVHHRKGARHLRLSLDMRNQIVVSRPWHCSIKQCASFIEAHRGWLEQQLDVLPRVVGINDWLKDSPWLSANGFQLAVTIQESARRRAGWQIDAANARADFFLPERTSQSKLPSMVRKFAKEVLSSRVDFLAGRWGLHYNGVSVRNQSTRWGSCSSGRSISLNWRLILIRPELQDYVILHELAHLKEMNHSKRFWNLLDTYDPNRREHEMELKALTPKIMRVQSGN